MKVEAPVLLLPAWAASVPNYVRRSEEAAAIDTREDRKWRSLRSTATTPRRSKRRTR